MEHVTDSSGDFEVGYKEYYDHVIEDISPQDTPVLTMLGESEVVDSIKYETYAVDLYARDGSIDIARATNTEVDDITSSDEDAIQMTGYTMRYFEFVEIDRTAEANKIAPPINTIDKKTARKLINMKQNYETRVLCGVHQKIHHATSEAGYFMGAPGIIGLDADLCNGGTSYGVDSPNVITSISSFSDASPDAIGSLSPADAQEVLDIVLQQRWDDGGNPNTLIVKSSDKRAIAGFDSSGATRMYNEKRNVVNNVEFYESPLGAIAVVPSHAYSDYTDAATDDFDTGHTTGAMCRDFALLFNPVRWKKTTLVGEGWMSENVAPRGLVKQRYITAELGVRCYNPAGDAIFNFTGKASAWSNALLLPTTAASYTD